MRLVLCMALVGLGLSSVGFAAVKSLKFEPKALGDYFENGKVIGGEAGRAFSIRSLTKKSENQNGLSEDIQIEIGDGLGQKLNGNVGFFQVAVENDPARVIIDLTQMHYSKIDERQVAAIFRDSGLIKSTDMTIDPEDFSTNLTLFLNKPVRVKVTSPEKQGQIRIKLEEQALKKEKKSKKNKVIKTESNTKK